MVFLGKSTPVMTRKSEERNNLDSHAKGMSDTSYFCFWEAGVIKRHHSNRFITPTGRNLPKLQFSKFFIRSFRCWQSLYSLCEADQLILHWFNIKAYDSKTGMTMVFILFYVIWVYSCVESHIPAILSLCALCWATWPLQRSEFEGGAV